MSRNMGIHLQKRIERENNWKLVECYMAARGGKAFISSIHRCLTSHGVIVERHYVKNMLHLKKDEGKIRCRGYLWELGDFKVKLKPKRQDRGEYKLPSGMSPELARMCGVRQGEMA